MKSHQLVWLKKFHHSISRQNRPAIQVKNQQRLRKIQSVQPSVKKFRRSFRVKNKPNWFHQEFNI